METHVLFFAVCGPKFAKLICMHERDRSLQCRFLFCDVLFHSVNIRGQVARFLKSRQNVDVFGLPIGGVRHCATKISNQNFINSGHQLFGKVW